MKGWDVYRRGRWVDTVFFDADCTEDYVRRSLIDHDGYPSDIQIRA